MERKWVVVACGDIRGFGAWTYRAVNSPEVKEPFISRFYRTMESYVRRHTDYHFKYLGDGFMTLREFTVEERRNGAIAKFIGTLLRITNGVRQDIAECDYPSPDGFRIRFMDGHAYKLMVLDPNDPARKRTIPEYVEYPLNTAQRLLEVNPDEICLATEGIVKRLRRHRSVFRVRPLGKPSCYPKGVNREDVDGLWVLESFRKAFQRKTSHRDNGPLGDVFRTKQKRKKERP